MLNTRHSLCLFLFIAAPLACPVLMTAQHTQASKLLLGAAKHRGLKQRSNDGVTDVHAVSEEPLSQTELTGACPSL